jgi:hypothetical protein
MLIREINIKMKKEGIIDLDQEIEKMTDHFQMIENINGQDQEIDSSIDKMIEGVIDQVSVLDKKTDIGQIIEIDQEKEMIDHATMSLEEIVIEAEIVIEVVGEETTSMMDQESSNALTAKVKVTCLENASSPKENVNQEDTVIDHVQSNASTAKVKVICPESALNQRRNESLEAIMTDLES